MRIISCLAILSHRNVCARRPANPCLRRGRFIWGGSVVEKTTLVKAPGRSVMQIEEPIRTVVLAWKVIAVCLGDKL